jgi:hypothetical protein
MQFRPSGILLFRIASIFVVVTSSVAVAHAVSYQVTLLHPVGSINSIGTGNSDQGQVGYGHLGDDDSSLHAFLWNGTAGSIVDLTPPGFGKAIAEDSSGGYQVGYASIGAYDYAILWEGTPMSAIELNPAGFRYSQAVGISGGFQVGSGSGPATGEHTHALLWNDTAASVVDLHPAGFKSSRAYDISGAAQVGAGVELSSLDTHALLWNGTAASAVDLHPAGYDSSAAAAVDSGRQAGNAYVGPNVDHAMLWSGTAASAVDLHPAALGFGTSRISGMSGAYQVGLAAGPGPDDPFHAVLWSSTAASAVDLHPYLVGLNLALVHSNASDIAPNGQIVGTAYDADFNAYAVLWTPIPEPSSSVICAIALVSTLMGRRIRQFVPNATEFRP